MLVIAGCGIDDGVETAGAASATATVAAEITSLDRAADCDNLLEVEDDGRTLVVETEGEEIGSVGIPYEALSCVYEALEMPASVVAKIGNTRAMDGMQDATWDNFSAFWTFHPDDGLSLVVEAGEEQ